MGTKTKNIILDLAVHMVVRDDVFYIDLALKSLLPYVKGIFIQDQGSTDGTLEIIKKYADWTSSVQYEIVDTGMKIRFQEAYNEPYWRTQCLKHCEWVFKPRWLLKCDADEIYTEYFFDQLEKVLKPDAWFECVRVSGERFVSKNYLARAPQDTMCHLEIDQHGTVFIDPHTQVWAAGKYYYIDNPSFPDSHFHPILDPDPKPQLWIPGVCNIHLHRLFGPKSVRFWEEGGEKLDKEHPYPPRDCPKWFNGPTNMGNAIQFDFQWPEYVLVRWRQWSEIW